MNFDSIKQSVDSISNQAAHFYEKHKNVMQPLAIAVAGIALAVLGNAIGYAAEGAFTAGRLADQTFIIIRIGLVLSGLCAAMGGTLPFLKELFHYNDSLAKSN